MGWKQVFLPGGSGIASNFKARVSAAVQQRIVLRLFQQINAGIAIIRTALTGVVQQRPAVALAQRTSGFAQVYQVPAFAVAQRSTGTAHKPLAAAGGEVVRIKYDLTHRSGSITVAQGRGSPSEWANLANAVGKRNGSLATAAGDVLGAREPMALFEYVDFPNKDTLVISSVKAYFYVRQQGTVLNNGSLQLYVEKTPDPSVWTVAFTGDVDHLTNPVVADVTTFFTSWTDLNSFRAVVWFRTDAGEALINAAIDAVELEVIASKVDAL